MIFRIFGGLCGLFLAAWIADFYARTYLGLPQELSLVDSEYIVDVPWIALVGVIGGVWVAGFFIPKRVPDVVSD